MTSDTIDVSVLPSSYIQAEWFESVCGGASNDNVTIALDIRGDLDEGALRAALHGLVARHETLRSCLSRTACGNIVQHVRRSLIPALDTHDATVSRSPTEALRHLVREEMHRPMILTACPLWRGVLVRIATRHYVLVLSLHHAISDRWSGGVVLRDLARLYEDAALRREPSLKDLSVQFGDYAGWERKQGTAALDREWRERLTPVPRYPAFPSASDWTPGEPFLLAARPFPTISPEDTARLRSHATARGRTLGVALQAVVAATVAPHTEREVILGVLYAIRDRPDLPPILGPLIDHLPLRIDIQPTSTYADLLDSVGHAWDTALANRLPLGRIVTALGGTAPMPQRPLFAVSVNYLPYAPDRAITAADGRGGTVRFAYHHERGMDEQDISVEREISLAVRLGHTIRGNAGGGLEGSLFVNAGAVGMNRVHELTCAFSHAVTALASNPDRPVRSLMHDLSHGRCAPTAV
jgi:hypothetical protein